jgi:hypothetical protein
MNTGPCAPFFFSSSSDFKSMRLSDNVKKSHFLPHWIVRMSPQRQKLQPLPTWGGKIAHSHHPQRDRHGAAAVLPGGERGNNRPSSSRRPGRRTRQCHIGVLVRANDGPGRTTHQHLSVVRYQPGIRAHRTAAQSLCPGERASHLNTGKRSRCTPATGKPWPGAAVWRYDPKVLLSRLQRSPDGRTKNKSVA